MLDELQPQASQEEQAPATPESPVQPPSEKMVPERDLRALQAKKDREVAAAKRDAELNRQRLEAIQASMEADVVNIARRTMAPEEAEQFIVSRRASQTEEDYKRKAYEAQKLQSIIDLSEKYNIPIQEFADVRANPYATQQDAFQVVLTHLQRKADDTAKEVVQKAKEAEALANQATRAERRVDGSDKIGTPAEPATAHEPLQAEYDRKKNEILKGARTAPSQRDWASALIRLKQEYREKGLPIP